MERAERRGADFSGVRGVERSEVEKPWVTEPSHLARSGALCADVWRRARLSGAASSRKKAERYDYAPFPPNIEACLFQEISEDVFSMLQHLMKLIHFPFSVGRVFLPPFLKMLL